MTRWLAVVGIGEDGLDGLAPAARALVDGAEVLVGGARHLGMVPADRRPRLSWPTPLTDLIPEIAALRGRPVCVLATGDPMWFGVGVTLARHFPVEEMAIVPAPSSFSLACARLGWSLADTVTLTLHGRPADLLRAHLWPGRRLLILSHDGASPAAIARILVEHGFAESRLTVLEHMGGPAECRHDDSAAAWGDRRTADLNLVAVALSAGSRARPLAPVPGLPDDAFAHDGQITKREVRAATLAALSPLPGQMLWDVGAGCGSVAIEWLRGHPGNRAAAVERLAARAATIAGNAAALGVPDLAVVHGEAPDALDDLPAPDAVFVGGGLSAAGLIDRCWEALAPGGRLVANAVTLEGEAALFVHRARWGGNMVRIAVSRAEPVGPFTGWRPLMPVTQWSAVKP